MGETNQKFVYDENRNAEEDLRQTEEINLPPHPQPLRTDRKLYTYDGDENDYSKRIFNKLYNAWILWAELINNEEIMRLTAKENDRESDEYKSINIIIDVIDHLGSLLGITRLDQECAWLYTISDKKDQE